MYFYLLASFLICFGLQKATALVIDPTLDINDANNIVQSCIQELNKSTFQNESYNGLSYEEYLKRGRIDIAVPADDFQPYNTYTLDGGIVYCNADYDFSTKQTYVIVIRHLPIESSYNHFNYDEGAFFEISDNASLSGEDKYDLSKLTPINRYLISGGYMSDSVYTEETSVLIDQMICDGTEFSPKCKFTKITNAVSVVDANPKDLSAKDSLILFQELKKNSSIPVQLPLNFSNVYCVKRVRKDGKISSHGIYKPGSNSGITCNLPIQN